MSPISWTDAARAELDAADARTRRHEVEAAVVARAERDRVDAVWEPIRAALEGLDALVVDLADLHRPELVWDDPVVGSHGPRAEGRLVCPGCDATDGLDPPDWPCATVRLLREHAGA